MLFNNAVFIGIDPTAGERPMTYAAIDHDLKLLALSKGDMNAVLAYSGGQKAAFVGINGPRRPNQKLMRSEEFRQELNPQPNPGRWTSFRAAEYYLFQKNIRIPRTAAEEDDCPSWMQVSFKLFKRLKEFGYQEFPTEGSKQQTLEVYPHASFTVLLERIPFSKRSLEGRLQRQLVLHSLAMDVPDPMRIFEEITRYRILQGVLPLNRLHSVEELDALVAAYTAWMAAKEEEAVTRMGDREEGEIILPVGDLADTYR
jgi:hypothetical protein